jgi:hypothetical protein
MNPNELQEIKAELARDQEKQDIERRRGNRRKIMIFGLLCFIGIPFMVQFGPKSPEQYYGYNNRNEWVVVSEQETRDAFTVVSCVLLPIMGIVSFTLGSKWGEDFPFDL